MLNVCCVKWGSKYEANYVYNLYEGVSRYLTLDHEFICFTEIPVFGVPCKPIPVDGLNGWWNKLALFYKGVFKQNDHVLYFDLDTLIVDNIDDIGSYRGTFAILRDFYRPNGYGSGVMSWQPSKCYKIWDKWDELGRFELMNGDQHWIEMVWPGADILQDLFPRRLVSYKVHCENHYPEDASVINFHGTPKPHECDDWVRDFWAVKTQETRHAS